MDNKTLFDLFPGNPSKQAQGRRAETNAGADPGAAILRLPVTLVCSKLFADTVQQNPTLVDAVYDFGSFMQVSCLSGGIQARP